MQTTPHHQPKPGIIIYAPPNSGKSRNALFLARHYGLTSIIDDDFHAPGYKLLPQPDTLTLTSIEGVPGAVALADALAEMQRVAA